MAYLTFALIFVFLCIALMSISASASREQQYIEDSARLKEEKKAEMEVFNREYKNLIEQNGEPDAVINIGRWDDCCLRNRFIVFENRRIIMVYGEKYAFSDILGYSLIDDATSTTIATSTGTAKTSTGGAVGRAILGGLIGGGVGAMAGATTANKGFENYTTSETTARHKFKIYININSLKNPTVKLDIGDNENIAYTVANTLNVIIERNKR